MKMIIEKIINKLDDLMNAGSAFDRAFNKTFASMFVVFGSITFILFLLCIIFDL